MSVNDLKATKTLMISALTGHVYFIDGDKKIDVTESFGNIHKSLLNKKATPPANAQLVEALRAIVNDPYTNAFARTVASNALAQGVGNALSEDEAVEVMAKAIHSVLPGKGHDWMDAYTTDKYPEARKMFMDGARAALKALHAAEKAGA